MFVYSMHIPHWNFDFDFGMNFVQRPSSNRVRQVEICLQDLDRGGWKQVIIIIIIIIIWNTPTEE